MNARRWILGIAAALVAASSAGGARAATASDGGSGLMDVDYAWSMPIEAIVVGLHGSFYSDNFTPNSSRLMRLTPGITKGLGGGFEGSAVLPIEGLTSDLDGEDYERRFDTRSSDMDLKARWTGSLGDPRVRVGVEGTLRFPLTGGTRDVRAGGFEKPGNAFEPGVVALVSTNLGWFDFPVRVHLNAGYWWSRDDGAVYFRSNPTPIALPDSSLTHNDVFSVGAAVEVGFRRFILFSELTTEQLWGARAQVRSSENLWRLTPGIRTELSKTIGLTAGVSFNLSTDDDATAFDPDNAYPDTELRVGLSLGNVLSRNRYESEKLRRQTITGWQMEPTAAVESAPAAGGVPSEIAAASASPVETPAPEAIPQIAGPARPGGVAPAAPVVAPEPGVDLARLERRLEQLELSMRLRAIDERLARLEQLDPAGGTGGAVSGITETSPGTAPGSTGTTAGSVATRDTTREAMAVERMNALMEQIRTLEDQLATMQRRIAISPSASPPDTAPATPSTGAAGSPATETPVGSEPTSANEPASSATPVTETPALSEPTSAGLAAAARSETPAVVAPAPRIETPAVVADAPIAENAPLQPDRIPVVQQQVAPAGVTVKEDGGGGVSKLAVAGSAAAGAALGGLLTGGSDSDDGASAPAQTTIIAFPAGSAPGAVTVESTPATAGAPRSEIEQLSREAEALIQSYPDRASTTDAPPPVASSAPVPVVGSGGEEGAAPAQQIDATGQGSASPSAAAGPPPATLPDATDGFPLAVGERAVIDGVDLAVTDSTVIGSAGLALDTWAAKLAAHPAVIVSMLVYGIGADRSTALDRSQTQAGLLIDYLVRHGAGPRQVAALGMGSRVDGGAPRVEIERLR